MGIPVDLNQRTNSICKEGSSRYGEEKTKLVPGARIELATPAFSGRRSTTELPRQWYRFKYFRERASLSQTFTHHDCKAAVTASIHRTLSSSSCPSTLRADAFHPADQRCRLSP